MSIDTRVKINREKCKVRQTEVPYLLTAGSFRMNPRKVEAIRDMPKANNNRQSCNIVSGEFCRRREVIQFGLFPSVARFMSVLNVLSMIYRQLLFGIIALYGQYQFCWWMILSVFGMS